ncbi:hypothetical protein D3C86_2006820 [compost metagenome]
MRHWHRFGLGDAVDIDELREDVADAARQQIVLSVFDGVEPRSRGQRPGWRRKMRTQL